jgi:hypothetical protein
VWGKLTTNLEDFKCPLCGKPLASDEYQDAIKKLERKVAETYNAKTEQSKQEYEQKIKKLTVEHEADVKNLKNVYEGQQGTLKKELQKLYGKQLTDLKKTFGEITRKNQKEFIALKKTLDDEHKKELLKKDKQLTEIRKGQSRLKKLAIEEAKTEAGAEIGRLKNDVTERDLQINRFKNEVDDLKKQLSQSQAELKGAAGEIDLYATLCQAFPDDYIRRQKRGTVSGDLVQRIRTPSRTLVTPIVYDNKQSERVTKKDIEKAKHYKKVHTTEYVIIVSSNLPKKDIKNGLCGEKEGILLAHPSIVVEVSRQIRKAIIEISRQSESKKDRETKESKLYDYVKSQDFASTIEKIYGIHQKMTELQDREEKAHERLWRERKELQSQINQTYVAISNGIDTIIQQRLPMEELTKEEDANQKEIEEPAKHQLPLLEVKDKKKKATRTESS